VPVDEVPPVRFAGFTATPLRLASGGSGVAVSVAVRVVPL
jgi:hypothetical protein